MKLLIFTSSLTLLCGSWLALMELVLRHTGYPMRFGIALLITAIALFTLSARALDLGVRSERWYWLGAAVLIGIGVTAFLHNSRATHFEGFALIISLVLALQGILMFAFLGHRVRRRT